MKKTKKGFTLVELVIVVAVMAILVAVAIPTVSSITDKASTAVANSNAQTIESMLKLHEANGASTFAWTKAEIETAINNSDLGIEKGVFYYHETNGTCRPKSGDSDNAKTGEWTITFTDYTAASSDSKASS